MESFFNTAHAVPLNHYIILSAIIFSIGVIGVLIRRNAIVIFMSVELMLNSVNLLLTAFSVYRGDATGQVFVFFIMALAAAEVLRDGRNHIHALQTLRLLRTRVISGQRWIEVYHDRVREEVQALLTQA